MSIRVPGLNVRRMPPAALVSSTVRMPTSAGGANAERTGRRVVSLVHVKATGLGQDHASAEPAERRAALVALDGGEGKPGMS